MLLCCSVETQYPEDYDLVKLAHEVSFYHIPTIKFGTRCNGNWGWTAQQQFWNPGSFHSKISKKSLIKSNIILNFCGNLSWGKRKMLRVHSSCHVTAKAWVCFLSIHMNMDNSSMHQEYRHSCNMMEDRVGESREAHGPDDLQYITANRLYLKQDRKQRPTPEGII